VIPDSRLAIGCVLPFATATSICRRMFTICSGVLLLDLAHSLLLPYQFVSLPLVQNLPGTPLCKNEMARPPSRATKLILTLRIADKEGEQRRNILII
jgi:hypothetical protein